MYKTLLIGLFLLLSAGLSAQDSTAFLLVLGVAQDGGYPHAGCEKKCCSPAWNDAAKRRFVVSLALADPVSRQWWLFEATPDCKDQLHYFNTLTKGAYPYLPAGIFVTHAHIGHYTGLMHLGREVMNTSNVPVYALPKMKQYLETNGPWSQLVSLKNIELRQLTVDSMVHLSGGIGIRTFTVPHRDEYSETAGFMICTPKKKYLFIPDINKWEKWDRKVTEVVRESDIAFVDGTCYDDAELPGRNMKEIQHPNVVETILLFRNSPEQTRSKIHFIHMNHTNPLMWDKDRQKEVTDLGFHIARQGGTY